MKETYKMFCDNLTVLDCALWDEQRGVIGMSWAVDVEFIGGLTEEGVVFDFSKAKKATKKIIDEWMDHRFLVPDHIVKKPSEYSNRIQLISEHPSMEYVCPQQGVYILNNVNASSIASELEDGILDLLSKEKDCAQLKAIKIKLREESDQNAHYFHYTHGLKEHYGNCQRLFHGHKSPIEIYVNGERNKDLEKRVSSEYDDIHLVFHENINVEKSTDDYYYIEYESSQGKFEAKLDVYKCIPYPFETTIENISKVIACNCAVNIAWEDDKHTLERIEAHAYEGIGKGCQFTVNSATEANKIMHGPTQKMYNHLQKENKKKTQLLKD